MSQIVCGFVKPAIFRQIKFSMITHELWIQIHFKCMYVITYILLYVICAYVYFLCKEF